MTLRINFIFVCEGTSDKGLIKHLEDLCVINGADEATGLYPDLNLIGLSGKSVSEKVRTALKLEPNADLIFIHRDSDARDPEPRYQEIHTQILKISSDLKYVPVIPVQETEAWLLTDANEIRKIAENPKGTVNLNLPKIAQIERTASPKEILKSAIVTASETSGRRLQLIKKRFSNKRRQLLERLDIYGDINQLKSWQRLKTDIATVIADLSQPI